MTDEKKVTIEHEEPGATTKVETDGEGNQTTGVETTPETTTVKVEEEK